MDIELLRTFLEVNRTSHFGKAAENLYLTQSAVSARIKQLEDSLGILLFERQRNNIRLTSSGLRFLRHAETIVASWQRARQEAGLEDQFTASLAIAGLADLWDPLLMEWIVKIRNHAPEIALHASSYSSPILIQHILNGQLDLAFLFEPQFQPETNTRFIKRINLHMVSTFPDLTSEQALAKDYVMIDWGTAYAINHAKHFPDAPSSSIFMSHASLALLYIRGNGGTAYLPDAWTNKLIDSGELYPVRDTPILEREIHAIWRANNQKINDITRIMELFNFS